MNNAEVNREERERRASIESLNFRSILFHHDFVVEFVHFEFALRSNRRGSLLVLFIRIVPQHVSAKDSVSFQVRCQLQHRRWEEDPRHSCDRHCSCSFVSFNWCQSSGERCCPRLVHWIDARRVPGGRRYHGSFDDKTRKTLLVFEYQREGDRCQRCLLPIFVHVYITEEVFSHSGTAISFIQWSLSTHCHRTR